MSQGKILQVIAKQYLLLINIHKTKVIPKKLYMVGGAKWQEVL